MEAKAGPVDQPDGGEVEIDWSPETVAAVFRALEGIDKNVSHQLARSVQARINAIKLIDREFGLLTESESGEVLGPSVDGALNYFTLQYRGQTLYPGFLFESVPRRRQVETHVAASERFEGGCGQVRSRRVRRCILDDISK